MVTEVTVNVPPRDISPALDGLDAAGDGEDEGDAAPPLPETRPFTDT
jgi:hypothetical protein